MTINPSESEAERIKKTFLKNKTKEESQWKTRTSTEL